MKKIEDQIPDSKLEFTVEPSVYIDIDDQGMSMDKRCDMIKILFFQLILICGLAGIERNPLKNIRRRKLSLFPLRSLPKELNLLL